MQNQSRYELVMQLPEQANAHVLMFGLVRLPYTPTEFNPQAIQTIACWEGTHHAQKAKFEGNGKSETKADFYGNVDVSAV